MRCTDALAALVTQTASFLYLTVIDMSLNGGLGAVLQKNQVLINDALNIGKISAVKHANGRDWWVVCHEANSSAFHVSLVTTDGVVSTVVQNIGIIRPADLGQVCFSPDGSKFAYYWGIEDLDVFDFDRCSGLFSNPVHIDIDDYDQMGGVAFSPNSQFLYVSSVLDVYQFDVLAPDIPSTQVHIAHWDSTYSPSPPFATVFDIAQLAPDGKIYIATGNGTFKLHVINAPDMQGLACDLVQHAITLPTYFMNSLPNHPNYHLGPLLGSPCDTLGLGVLEEQPVVGVSAFPNPCAGHFALNYPARPETGWLEVRDMSGRVVQHERLPAWSQMHAVGFEDRANGLYLCTVRWGEASISITIALER